MDQTTGADSGISAVLGALIGTATYGLGRYIDREYPQPWTVNDPAAWQYTIGPNGQYYQRGTPGNLPGSVSYVNPGIVLFGGLALLGLAFVALKG